MKIGPLWCHKGLWYKLSLCHHHPLGFFLQDAVNDGLSTVHVLRYLVLSLLTYLHYYSTELLHRVPGLSEEMWKWVPNGTWNWKHTKYIQHYVKLLLYSLSNGEIWTWVFLNFSRTRTWLSHIHNSLQLGWSGRLRGRHGFPSKHGSLNENHSGSLQLFKRWLLGERRRATLPHHYDSVGRISAGRHAASRPASSHWLHVVLYACRDSFVYVTWTCQWNETPMKKAPDQFSILN